MNPLEQIKNIIVESEKHEQEETSAEEGMEHQSGRERSEKSEMGNGKAKQMANVQSMRSQESPGEMPGKGGEVVLTAPGVDLIKSLIAKIPQATHPSNDPKAKASSNRIKFDDVDTNLDNNRMRAVDSQAATHQDSDVEESTEKGEEYEPNEKGQMIKEKKPAMKEHLDALFNGEELSEDFKNKAALIFETALAEREAALAEEIAAEYEALAEEYVELVQNELNEQIDSYLGYVVNEWVEENRLQVENGVRLEIAESFIENMREVFVNHGVDVPDSDVDLVEELSNQIAELEGRLNEEINRNIEMNESLEAHRRNEVIATLGEDLTAAEFEKFANLCESVSYDTDDNFINKIATIRESYFMEGAGESNARPTSFLSEAAIDDETPAVNNEVLNESMEQYVQTLSRFGKK